MPVLRVDDPCARFARLIDLPVDDRHDEFTFRDVEAASGIGEVVLNIDHQQGRFVVVIQ